MSGNCEANARPNVWQITGPSTNEYDYIGQMSGPLVKSARPNVCHNISDLGNTETELAITNR